MAYKSTCKTLEKVAASEEIFVLRAQDMTAPGIIIEWIRENINLAPDEKLREAFECALRMRKSEHRKFPD